MRKKTLTAVMAGTLLLGLGMPGALAAERPEVLARDLPPATATVPLPIAGSAPPMTSHTASPAGMARPSSRAGDKSNLTTSPKEPQIVRDAVKALQKTDPINLDDMIRAQDAINRLDLLLDIEKRQVELKKLRDEKKKPARRQLGIGKGIPASVLKLPPVRANSSAPIMPRPRVTKRPPPPASGKYVVRRIMGANGSYKALIESDKRTLNVGPGEKLPDGSRVKSITLTSVSIVKKGKRKVLTIPSDNYIVRGGTEAMD